MHKRMDNLSENFGKIKVGPAVPPKPKKQQPQVPKSCNVKQVSQPSYSTVLQRQFNDGSHVYSNEMLQGGPRTMTLDNSIDLQHQKEVLEYKKKMLDNMRGEKIYENQNNMYENMKHYPEESAYANIGNKNLIYSNLMSHDDRQNDLPPPPMVPLTLNEMSLSGNDDEFPPPPSPVSSSYSELRRATDSCPKPPPQYNNPALPYSNIMHQNASIYANNMHQPTYGTYGISSQKKCLDFMSSAEFQKEIMLLRFPANPDKREKWISFCAAKTNNTKGLYFSDANVSLHFKRVENAEGQNEDIPTVIIYSWARKDKIEKAIAASQEISSPIEAQSMMMILMDYF